ncbi:WAT1-related protein At2g39510-like [Dendrobium catenatum]|uniref:WAT1-related protein n=1 Tax=Dendrobium catenatum TaxID=906689 RepID=A0A2I0WT95_9ASPA|nr:WAT1-related protein At2g39510-like [Dendrobium catenatum]PKU78876.1 WAT1-related protein [Dendrobium catenatum]
MALQAFQGTCRRFKPHILMFLAQIGYTILYFITEASFNHGMNPHVYITYRNFVAGFAMLPFAYFLERKLRPKLTFALFVEIFVLSLLGVGLTLNMYFASLRYTSPAFLSSMVNTIPSMTFVIAVLLRLEHLNVQSLQGSAKVIGTMVCLAGVIIMTLYKGSAVRNLWGAVIHMQGNTIHENWLKGSIFTVTSCVTWSVWYIMQAITLQKYPAQLSLTTWMSFIGGAQSAVFALYVEHKASAWIIKFDIDLWSTLYGGIVCSGIIIFIQLWCTKEKGPVFVTMFNPLSTILVALLAYFVFGERLFIGSIIGGVIVIIGLYLVLWGKDSDEAGMKPQSDENKLEQQKETCHEEP